VITTATTKSIIKPIAEVEHKIEEAKEEVIEGDIEEVTSVKVTAEVA